MSISSDSSAESAAKMTEEPEPVKGPPRNVVTGLIKAARPRQWVKNLLVLIAPVAAFGSDVHYDFREVAVKVSIAFVAFSLAASSVYLVNDARDVEADRAAPDQAVSGPSRQAWCRQWLAYCTAAVLAAAALAVSFLATPNLAGVIGVYIAMQLAYCFGLKHQAVLDICIVSSAYLIRAIAGGVAANIPLSQWFLLVMTFGSLFMVAGKRYAELQLAETDRGEDPKVARELHVDLSALRLDAVGHRDGGLLRAVGLRARRRQRFLVRGHDDPVHDRDPALRRRRRRRAGGRAGGDRVEGPGAAASGRRVDRNHRCRSLLRLTGVPARPRGRLARWPAFPYDITARISLWLSVLVVAALFGWGAWQRRWIADDGLIVLRTVRNLLAGNGPVFNEGRAGRGEHVDAVDVPELSRRRGRRPGPARVRGAGAGAGAQRARASSS